MGLSPLLYVVGKFLMEQNPILVSCLIVLLLFTFSCLVSSQNDDVDGGSGSGNERVWVRVGLVLDLGSVEGKMVGSSVSMALSDFYSINSHYKTRLSLSFKNSHGEPLLALASGTHFTLPPLLFFSVSVLLNNYLCFPMKQL